MIIPTSLEEIATLIENKNTVLFFTAGWCGDCVYIKPAMPEIELLFPNYTFVQIDRDEFIDLCAEWDIYGIPSFVVTQQGEEVGRFVNKQRKTKEEIVSFLHSVSKK